MPSAKAIQAMEDCKQAAAKACPRTTVPTEGEERATLEADGFTIVDDNHNTDHREGSRSEDLGLEPEGDEDSKEPEKPVGSEDELEHMMSKWDSLIYAFFQPIPEIEYVNGCRSHIFKCAACGCKVHIWCYLDRKDRSSTGNLRCHAQICWGQDAVHAACAAADLAKAGKNVAGGVLRKGSITASFTCKKETVTYSHCPHTCTKMQTEIARWVAENLHPFKIVCD
ncbi:hypothetical protein C8Q76DRAFT_793347 [Earliella scabrosa]|nr:hypothetical protein C8Q76DRAFT_793347 [Earliella scabrosa]